MLTAEDIAAVKEIQADLAALKSKIKALGKSFKDRGDGLGVHAAHAALTAFNVAHVKASAAMLAYDQKNGGEIVAFGPGR